ncbi:hypothetical protein SAM23877_3005 [Streptomyces ambofaciens ATCC 23877]|uniref:Uncharacterized protein n=1 Tax=Streptomyces ambofaciens (strain ATCC 23877 / 3486 / DSM 40053 / JCM 4204 / NBRC 12836 / NRRL B-2516) TaxID=278992 RepID=A0A0K2AST5_STRA7|nr:hypothetical protein SAM23877_3005 [Streptomyces ambofaciens ATCC 23877]
MKGPGAHPLRALSRSCRLVPRPLSPEGPSAGLRRSGGPAGPSPRSAPPAARPASSDSGPRGSSPAAAARGWPGTRGTGPHSRAPRSSRTPTGRTSCARPPCRRLRQDNAHTDVNVPLPLCQVPWGPARLPPEAGPVCMPRKGRDKTCNCRATPTGDCGVLPGSRMVTLIYPRRPVVHP